MPPFILLLLFVAVLVIMGLAYWFSEAMKIRRALREARVVAIAQAQEGEIVRLTGAVRAIGPMLRAPLSGRPCVYFDVLVEEYRSSGKSGRWVKVIQEKEAVDFLVEDGTGKALVDSGAMKVLAVKDHDRRSGTFNDASPELEAYLQRHGRKSQGWVFNKSLRYREAVFEPGERVTVLGAAHWEQDPDPSEAGSGYRGIAKRLVLRPRPDGPILASDEPDLT